jgi:hypothetical protein
MGILLFWGMLFIVEFDTILFTIGLLPYIERGK